LKAFKKNCQKYKENKNEHRTEEKVFQVKNVSALQIKTQH